MATYHSTSEDPLDLAEAGVINLVSLTPSTPRSYVEVLLSTGKYSADALKVIRPLEQWEIVYELLDDASLVLPFGIAVNTNYLITAADATCQPEAYPLVSVSIIKPSSATMIKAGTEYDFTIAGGYGIVNKWGATSASSFVSSAASISMQSLDLMDEASGDFLVDGIYRFGFKMECQAEAYAAIVTPVAAHATPNAPATPNEKREGPQTYSASWWTYLDPAP